MRWAAASVAVLALPAAIGAADTLSHLTSSSARFRIACVGDSITYGAGLAAPVTRSYPARLAERFPTGRVVVGNFGAPGRTLLRDSDHPYLRTSEFRAATAFAPNAVVVLLGANDTRPPNRPKLGEFKRDAADLVRRFQALPSRPMVFVALPTPAWENPHGVDGSLLREFVILRWCEVAAECRAHVIDLHTPLLGVRDRFPDGVHPNEEGARAIATLVYEGLRSRLPGADRLGPESPSGTTATDTADGTGVSERRVAGCGDAWPASRICAAVRGLTVSLAPHERSGPRSLGCLVTQWNR